MSEKKCEFYRPNLCGIPYSCKSPSWYNCKIVDAGRELANSWKPKEPTDEMAKITRIVEYYDNGHSNEFNPTDYFIAEKADLKLMIKRGSSGNYGAWKKFWNQIKEKYLAQDTDKKSKN